MNQILLNIGLVLAFGIILFYRYKDKLGINKDTAKKNEKGEQVIYVNNEPLIEHLKKEHPKAYTKYLEEKLKESKK